MAKISVLICAVFMAFYITSSESRPHGGLWGGYHQSHRGYWDVYRGFGDSNQNTRGYHGNGDDSHSGEVYNTQYKRPFGGHRPNWHTHNDECVHYNFGYDKSSDEDVENTNSNTYDDINNTSGGENVNIGKTPDDDINTNAGNGENTDTGKPTDENTGGEKIDFGNSSENDVNTGGENVKVSNAEETTVKDSNGGSGQSVGETTEYPFKIDIRFGGSSGK